jgi:hypothetical protein
MMLESISASALINLGTLKNLDIFGRTRMTAVVSRECLMDLPRPLGMFVEVGFKS